MDITISTKNKIIDIQVNRRQRIEDTISVLINGGVLNLSQAEGDLTIRSKRKGEQINQKMTFEQAGIYNGDIVSLEENNESLS